MTHPTRTPTHWRSRAACRDTNPDLFFPEPSAPRSQTAAAKAVCARCPVRDACLDEAPASLTGSSAGLPLTSAADSPAAAA
jgi:hypothetical protein